MMNLSLLKFKLILFDCSAGIPFVFIFDKVYYGLLFWVVYVLEVDAPPTADQALILLIDPNLWYLTHLTRRIALKKSQDLVTLLTYFLFIIVVSDFYYVKGEVLVVDLFFLDYFAFYMGVEIILLIDIQKLIFVRLCN